MEEIEKKVQRELFKVLLKSGDKSVSVRMIQRLGALCHIIPLKIKLSMEARTMIERLKKTA